jgi:hypothetical protein
MKRLLGAALVVVAALLCIEGNARADLPFLTNTGTLTTAGNAVIVTGLSGQSQCAFQATGFPSAVDAKGSNDGTNWTTIGVYDYAAPANAQGQPFTPNAGQSYMFAATSFKRVEVAADATWSGGPASVLVSCSSSVARVGGGGGGGGSVNSVTGSSPITSSGGSNPNIACAACVLGLTAGANVTVGSGTHPSVAVVTTPSFAGLTLSALTGSTQCVQVNTSGVVSGSGGACNSGSTYSAGQNITFTGSGPTVIATTPKPLFVNADFTDANLVTGAGNCLETILDGSGQVKLTVAGGPCGTTTGSVNGVTASGPLASSGGLTPNISFTGILALLNGGNATGTPSFSVSGPCLSSSGAWAAQTVTYTCPSPPPAAVVTATSPLVVATPTPGTFALSCPTCLDGATAGTNIVLSGSSTAPTIATTASPTFTNVTTGGFTLGTSSGCAVLTGGVLGAQVCGATTLTSATVESTIGSSQTIAVSQGSGFANGTYLTISNGTYAFLGKIQSGGTTNSLTIETLYNLIGGPSNTLPIGSVVAPSGPQYQYGAGIGYTSGTNTLFLQTPFTVAQGGLGATSFTSGDCLQYNGSIMVSTACSTAYTAGLNMSIAGGVIATITDPTFSGTTTLSGRVNINNGQVEAYSATTGYFLMQDAEGGTGCGLLGTAAYGMCLFTSGSPGITWGGQTGGSFAACSAQIGGASGDLVFTGAGCAMVTLPSLQPENLTASTQVCANGSKVLTSCATPVLQAKGTATCTISSAGTTCSTTAVVPTGTVGCNVGFNGAPPSLTIPGEAYGSVSGTTATLTANFTASLAGGGTANLYYQCS